MGSVRLEEARGVRGGGVAGEEIGEGESAGRPVIS